MIMTYHSLSVVEDSHFNAQLFMKTQTGVNKVQKLDLLPKSVEENYITFQMEKEKLGNVLSEIGDSQGNAELTENIEVFQKMNEIMQDFMSEMKVLQQAVQDINNKYKKSKVEADELKINLKEDEIKTQENKITTNNLELRIKRLEKQNAKLREASGAKAIGSSEETVNNKYKIAACLTGMYNAEVDWYIVGQWVEFHHKRWNLNLVDVYVLNGTETSSQWKIEMQQKFKSEIEINILQLGIVFPDIRECARITDYYEQLKCLKVRSGKENAFQTRVLKKCLKDNQERKVAYMLNMDADEFLVSETFPNFQSMFSSPGKHAVSFPVFAMSYRTCSVFDGPAKWKHLVYGAHYPTFYGNASDPFMAMACSGHRKYVVQPEYFKELKVHDPNCCAQNCKDFDNVIYLNGKEEDNQHARVYHLREDKGIHTSPPNRRCERSEDCEYIFQFKTWRKSCQPLTKKVEKILALGRHRYVFEKLNNDIHRILGNHTLKNLTSN